MAVTRRRLLDGDINTLKHELVQENLAMFVFLLMSAATESVQQYLRHNGFSMGFGAGPNVSQ